MAVFSYGGYSAVVHRTGVWRDESREKRTNGRTKEREKNGGSVMKLGGTRGVWVRLAGLAVVLAYLPVVAGLVWAGAGARERDAT